jgi:type VI secretion system secreted protein VgrG
MLLNRPIELHIESGGARWGGVSVLGFTGRESISELFVFDVDVAVVDEGGDLDGRAVPGVEVSLVFELGGVEVRRLHGILGRVRDRMQVADLRRTYRLRVHPRLHRLNAIETQEVFLDLSIPQIIERKLDMHGFSRVDFELRLMGTYDPRDIVVQFAESDVAFISRLCEHVGISFFFEHEDGVDKVVFTDHAGGFSAIAGHDEAVFHGHGQNRGVFGLEVDRDTVPARYFVQDYNYRTPLLDPTGSFDLDPEGDGGVVEYGSHVKSPEEAARIAQVRAEERGATRVVYEVTSDHMPASAGRRTVVLDHPLLAARESLTVVSIEHEGSFPYLDETDAKPRYQNRIAAIPSAVVFRPPRRTPRPRIHGFVTGVIQPGPQGEIGGVAKLTDDGRYTVQIHFDTAVRGQQKASHPVRMAQPFAGHGNSMHFPLLPGTEVIVGFANGDPDRPIILGALPNPVSPSTIAAEEAHTHRVRSSQGVVIEFGNTVPGRP